jgi:NAD(P)-dependent dehydrogenase (short-subunit alcohol dehydrogenase family)
MLLDGRNAVVYGGGGAIGGAVAAAFAREGARVFLAGRTAAPLEAVAARIREAGGDAAVQVLDALDESAVDAFADRVAAEAGSLDVSFNAISVGDVQGTPMVEMSLADYLRPIDLAVRSTFITARAAARHMTAQHSGVILMFGGDDGTPIRDYSIGGFQVALTAVEAMRRQLSAELGRHGVRAVTLITNGIAETIPDDMPGASTIVAGIEGSTLLGRAATLADVGDVAAFVASDRARTMTAATVNVSCGALVD